MSTIVHHQNETVKARQKIEKFRESRSETFVGGFVVAAGIAAAAAIGRRLPLHLGLADALLPAA